MNEKFKNYLLKENLSEKTITSYLWTVNYFNSAYLEVNKSNLLAYKGYLMENFKPKTVNLRLQAINKFIFTHFITPQNKIPIFHIAL